MTHLRLYPVLVKKRKDISTNEVTRNRDINEKGAFAGALLIYITHAGIQGEPACGWIGLQFDFAGQYEQFEKFQVTDYFCAVTATILVPLAEPEE